MPHLGHSLVLRPCFLPASTLKLAEPLYSVLHTGSLAPGNTFLSHSDKFSRIMRYILTSQLSVQFSSVTQSIALSHVQFFVTPWTAAHQASLSITNSWRLLKLMSIKSVMPSYHHIILCPPLLLPSIFLSIRVFPSESVLCIRWPNRIHTYFLLFIISAIIEQLY